LLDNELPFHEKIPHSKGVLPFAEDLQPVKQPHPVRRISRFSNPDSIRNPKQRLTRIFTQELGPRRRYGDYQHSILIAGAIEDFTKIRRSDSFQRFALKVAGMEL
jgi:hypothetical protein